MSDSSKIEWTDATWNPVTGCTEVSPGCDRCYAKTLAERFRGTPGHYFEQGFDVVLRPERLDQPLRWKRPRRVFVNSMSDLFHADVPDSFIADLWAVMSMAPRHTFQILTKRHGRMRALLRSPVFKLMVNAARLQRGVSVLPDSRRPDGTYAWPLANVWLGVSVEDQQRAELRIPALADTPASVRFLSCEPLLGPLDLTPWLPRHREVGLVNGALNFLTQGGRCDMQPGDIPSVSHHVTALCRQCTNGRRISWVIAGGESGHGARPMHPGWVRDLRDQCTASGVAFHFKQWGEWVPESVNVHRDNDRAAYIDVHGWVRELVDGRPTAPPYARGNDVTVRRAGKRLAGRQLDGRTWDEFPIHDATDGSVKTGDGVR